MTLDQFNSIFPFIACSAPILNIRKVLQDKEVKGVHWFSLITYSGQVSGIYFLYTLEQWWSMFGSASYFVLSFTWYCMMIYYNYIRQSDDSTKETHI